MQAADLRVHPRPHEALERAAVAFVSCPIAGTVAYVCTGAGERVPC